MSCKKIGVRDIGSGSRGVELLLRNDLLGGELSGAREIGVSLVGVGAGGADLRVECGTLSGGALNLSLRLSGESATTGGRFGSGVVYLNYRTRT